MIIALFTKCNTGYVKGNDEAKMDQSRGLPLGSELPDFWLPDINGVIVPKELLIGGPASLVVFMCNHSPYVKHIREVLVKVIWEYQQRGISVVAINPNDINLSPEDCPNRMKEEARLYGYTFPYLFDGTQSVARSFNVLFTPDFFVFDREGKLAYHGQMDDSRPENNLPVTGKDLRDALNAAILGEKPPSIQKPSSGSVIRWRKQM